MKTEAVPAEQPEPINWKTRFFAIWIGRAASLIGNQLVQFALIWYLTQLEAA